MRKKSTVEHNRQSSILAHRLRNRCIYKRPGQKTVRINPVAKEQRDVPILGVNEGLVYISGLARAISDAIGYDWDARALEALGVSADKFLVDLFTKAQACASVSNRITVTKGDVHLATKMIYS